MKALFIVLFLIVCLMSKTVDPNHDYYYGSFWPQSRIIRRTIVRRPLYNTYYPRTWGRYSSVWKHNDAESQEASHESEE